MRQIVGTRELTVTEDFVIDTDENGRRHVFLGQDCLATETEPEAGRIFWLAVAVLERFPRPKTVGCIGGGTFMLPRILSLFGLTVTTFELREELQQLHDPAWGALVLGDYKQTLKGTYDVLVYDLGEEADVARLSPHLAPGGLRLGW